jgi:hypothetical protein
LSRANIYPENNKIGKEKNNHHVFLKADKFYPGFRRFHKTKVDLRVTLHYPQNDGVK